MRQATIVVRMLHSGEEVAIPLSIARRVIPTPSLIPKTNMATAERDAFYNQYRFAIDDSAEELQREPDGKNFTMAVLIRSERLFAEMRDRLKEITECNAEREALELGVRSDDA